MYSVIGGNSVQLKLPSPDQMVLPGIKWGGFDEILTPAYWRGQAWQHLALGTYSDLRLGDSLAEEVAACLLGGYGMPAGIAMGAYQRVRSLGLLRQTPSSADVERALEEPIQFGSALRKYRFARQKARYLSESLRMLEEFVEPSDDIEFRDALAHLPGIGLKTASWIVRNMRPGSRVAVVDVHILRAGRHIGLFPDGWIPEKNYRELEQQFVKFADALEINPSFLDALMWDYMRRFSEAVFRSGQNGHSKQLTLFEDTRQLMPA
ncbi:8-oxoguanine DNA glycosylase [Occallatibacter riparius]